MSDARKGASTLVVIGLVLALLGGIGLAIEGVTWEDREQVVDLGPVEASTTVERRTRIPPLAAGGVLILGLGVAGWGALRTR